MTTDAELREQVRSRYAEAATATEVVCCDVDCCEPTAADITGGLCQPEDIASVPSGAAEISLGCGNPTAVAELRAGETVLDLGSGAGIDVLLSANRVGPSGFVYGLDMTDEMLELARKHQEEAGANNVEFLKGYIEDVPLPAAAVDVVISNCVINLSADKPAVLSEMFRVLRPGGRIGISDVVADNELSPEDLAQRGSWVGCTAGALTFSEYERGLREAGFTEINLTPTHQVAEGLHSAMVKAIKPA